jgi:small-conductance mechanosensitive channel
MIKFFRKIRYDLMEKNNNGKYIKYAIGEIVLVVVGILIALSISNWNEMRKQAREELKVLSEIQSNLNQSRKEIEDVLFQNETHLRKYISLLNHIEQKLPYSVELDSTFNRITSWASPYLTYTAYESLKSRGSELVKNDSLRKQIAKMYENEMTYLMNDWDKSEWRNSESVVLPYYAKHFAENLDEVTTKPNNYDALIDDVEFTNLLRITIVIRKWGNQSCRDIIASIDKLIGSIENELDQRGFNKN